MSAVDQAGAAVADDPLIIAARRNLALKRRLSELDAELADRCAGLRGPGAGR